MHRFWKDIINPLINKINPSLIVEVGSENGFNTKHLLDYSLKNNSSVYSIDPFPLFDVKEFKDKYGSKFEMFEGLSVDVLPNLKDYDLILLDGDHNWYTIYNELKIIENTFNQNNFPFIIFHDISWPYARRDLYYNPENIPKEFLNDYEKKGMIPGQSELLETGGMNAHLNNAKYENTPKNGVLTGIEDFINECSFELTFKSINVFHGLGFLYPADSNTDKIIDEIISNADLLRIAEEYYLKKVINNDLLFHKNQKKLVKSYEYSIHEHKKVINNREEVIIDLRNAIDSRNKKIAEQNDIIKKMKDNINNLETKNRDNEVKINNLMKEKNEILSSKSWKLTKPLRIIKNKF